MRYIVQVCLCMLSCQCMLARTLSFINRIFGGSCADHTASPAFDRLLAKQSGLSRHLVPEDYTGPIHVSEAHLQHAADTMLQATVDPSHRVVFSEHPGHIVIGCKFFVGGGGESFLRRRLMAYAQLEAIVPIVRTRLKKSGRSSTLRVITTGYGWGGAVAFLLASALADHPNVASVKAVTFDDPSMLLRDPVMTRPFGAVRHLRFMSNRTAPEEPCASELLTDFADVLAVPHHKIEEKSSPVHLRNINYVLYFAAGLAKSIGRPETAVIEEHVGLASGMSALAVPTYLAKSDRLDVGRVDEAADAALSWLSRSLGVSDCRHARFNSLGQRFEIECFAGKQQVLVLAAMIVPVRDGRAVCRDMTRQQQLRPASRHFHNAHACFQGLITMSNHLHRMFRSCQHIPVDRERLSLVLLPLRPLEDAFRVYRADAAGFMGLLDPDTSRFPPQCKRVIRPRLAEDHDKKMWSLARHFLKASFPNLDVCKSCLASKHDGRHFEAKRVSFNVHNVRGRVDMQALHHCLANSRPHDCTDPVNRWIRPRVCPRRCARKSAALCDQVVKCDGLYISVQSTSLFFASSLDAAIEARRQDRYVAYHVRAKADSFGWFGLYREFYLAVHFQ